MASLGELLAAGELKQASALAQRRLGQNPSDGEALVALAKVAVAEGQPARAEEWLKRAVAPGSQREVALVRAALALGREDWAGAQELYVALVREPSPPAEAWYGLGVVRSRVGDAEAACEALQRAVALEPLRASFHFELGRAWAMREQVRPAVREFVSCLRLEARDARAWRFIAELLAQRGKARSARRILEHGQRLVPEAGVLREPLPEPVKGAPAGVPDAQRAVVAQVVELMGRSRNREALKLVRETLAKGERSLVLQMLEAKAGEAMIQPDVEGTVRAYEAAMAMAPEAWEACNDLGLFLLKQGQRHMARAVEVLQEARKRAPGRPEPVFNLAVAYSKGGKGEESAGLARQLVQPLPPSTCSINMPGRCCASSARRELSEA